MSEIHTKLKKLLALAREGVGGEKDNAQERLESLMRKHGITLDQLDGEERKLEWFRLSAGDYGKRLFYQTLRKVCGECPDTYKSTYKRGQLGADVTVAEKVEIELRYPAYAAALQKEMDVCFSAFIHVNNIFPDDGPSPDPGDINLAEIERLIMAMKGMKPVEIHRALGDGVQDRAFNQLKI